MPRAQKSTNDFLSKVDAFFANRWKIILGICCFFTLVFGMFLFDAKLSVGGDDSAYIMRAMNFLREGKFPSFQGALYPLFLSGFVGLRFYSHLVGFTCCTKLLKIDYLIQF